MALITPIEESRFLELTAPLLRKPIAAVWLGDFTSLYLEVGSLVDTYESGRSKADHTVYLGFDWLLESDSEPVLSSSDPEARSRVQSVLVAQSIIGIAVSESLELLLSLSSYHRLSSKARTHDREWAVFLPSGSSLGARAQSLVLESRAA